MVDQKTKKMMALIAFGVVLLVLLTNISALFGFMQKLFAVFLPVISGLIVALILSVPMRWFEKTLWRLSRRCKRRLSQDAIRKLSFALTIVCVAIILLLVCTLVVPEMSASIKSVSVLVQNKWPEWKEILKTYGINTESISELMANANVNKFLENIAGGSGSILSSVANVSVSVLSGVLTALISVIIGMYVLSGKKNLAQQGRNMLYAYCKQEYADKIVHIAKLSYRTYSRFLSGQCIEAVILGCLLLLAFTILRLPYAGLVAVVAGVCAFVPYIGAYVACIIGAFLTLVSDPSKTLLCIGVYLVVQFIETQFIYPRVVGKSVGLSPLTTLVATVIGGALFGVWGIMFFIPLAAVLHELAQEQIKKRLSKKENQI